MSPRQRRGRGDGTVYQRAATMDTNTEGEVVTLTEFLLARIAEDERTPAWDETGALARRPRVLAECEAKRRIIEKCTVAGAPIKVQVRQGVYEYKPYRYPADDGPCEDVLHLLALPYADHPDCRDEWKP